MKDHLLRLTSVDGTLRATAASTRDLIEELRRRHGTDPTATVALGRLATGTVLLGSLLKGKQRLALMLEGNGPLQKLHAETDAEGHVRATVKNPVSGLPPSESGFPVAQAIGKAGFLHVIKDLELKEPYQSMVQLYSSEVAEDLAYYLATSEQIPSSVALGVSLTPTGGVAAAGGFLIQALPGCPQERLQELEQHLAGLPPVTTLLAGGSTPGEILGQALEGIPLTHGTTLTPAFRCTCSMRQVTAMLRSLPPEERQELARRQEATEVSCEYCRQVYRFTPEELAGLAENDRDS